MSATTTAVDKPKRHKEIYTYEAPWTIFALGASQNSDPRFMFRMAVGSFVEEYVNKVQVSDTMSVVVAARTSLLTDARR